MAEAKKNDEPLLSGEVLKLTGLSKKELQVFDELELLHSDAHSRGQVRLYDQSTLRRIEQLTFYEAQQIPLEVTREILANPHLQRADAVLDAQLMLLYNDLDRLNTQITCIEACKELDRAGETVSWGTLTRLFKKIPDDGLQFWDLFQPDAAGDGASCNAFDSLWNFYQTWKLTLIRAVIFQNSGLEPTHPLAKSLGLQRLNWRREVESADSTLVELFNRLETDQAWLRRPPFTSVFIWLSEVEAGL